MPRKPSQHPSAIRRRDERAAKKARDEAANDHRAETDRLVAIAHAEGYAAGAKLGHAAAENGLTIEKEPLDIDRLCRVIYACSVRIQEVLGKPRYAANAAADTIGRAS